MPESLPPKRSSRWKLTFEVWRDDNEVIELDQALRLQKKLAAHLNDVWNLEHSSKLTAQSKDKDKD